MAHERFLDREDQPTGEVIQKTIGREVYPVWQEVCTYLAQNFPDYDREEIFYSVQHGWAVRYRKQAHQLCLLFPERRAFSALVTLTAEEDAAALDRINFFNARLRELLNQPSSLPEGRWLWMRFQDHTDFVGFKLLMEIKQRYL